MTQHMLNVLIDGSLVTVVAVGLEFVIRRVWRHRKKQHEAR